MCFGCLGLSRDGSNRLFESQRNEGMFLFQVARAYHPGWRVYFIFMHYST